MTFHVAEFRMLWEDEKQFGIQYRLSNSPPLEYRGKDKLFVWAIQKIDATDRTETLVQKASRCEVREGPHVSSKGLTRKEWVERKKTAWWSCTIFLVDPLSEAKVN